MAVRLIVKGRVQRVGFRRYVLDLAQDMGLAGYVKNLPEGSVEVFVQGLEGSISKFIEAVKSPHPPAVVREVLEKPVEPRQDVESFEVIYGELAEELQEGFGAMQSVFADYWGEFRGYLKEFGDFRQEFRDLRQEFREFARRTDENFRLMLEKYGEISEKLTVILETLVRESKETRGQIAKALEKLTEAVETLKER